MDWIKITTKLPPFNKRVLFRGLITWRKQQWSYFDDELTHEEETLEYGQSAYILKDNSDFLVSQNSEIEDYCSEFVTHWCELPELENINIALDEHNKKNG